MAQDCCSLWLVGAGLPVGGWESAGSQVLLLLLLLLEGLGALAAPSFRSPGAPAAGSCLHCFQMSQVPSLGGGSVQTPFA